MQIKASLKTTEFWMSAGYLCGVLSLANKALNVAPESAGVVLAAVCASSGLAGVYTFTRQKVKAAQVSAQFDASNEVGH